VADTLTRADRSRLMGRVRQKNTSPELAVRRAAHRLGYRFRLHKKDLPGRPDLVFPRHRKVVFVHGCFWHRHDCKKATTPTSNVEFWQRKFAANVSRDRNVLAKLHELGWSTMVVWECQVQDQTELNGKLLEFLRGYL
jgi:DNA mismatch endonuclease (patch repair protein)